jgi:hypothetical protein
MVGASVVVSDMVSNWHGVQTVLIAA